VRDTLERIFPPSYRTGRGMGLALICILVAGVGALPPDWSPGADPCAEASAGLAAHPDDGDARNRLGWCRYRAGSFAEAAAAFEEELKRRPGDADASVGLAYARLQQGDVQAARNLFRDVLRRHAGNGDARRGLSLAALRAPGEELRFEADADPARPPFATTSRSARRTAPTRRSS
jgi:tetratricopeptide (TPR) repeat protein